MANISVFIGTVAPLPDSGRPSGIVKHPVSGPIHLGREGFDGDQHADLRVHGGPDKAVHLYPAAHYARIANQFPQVAGDLVPGSLGENISSAVLDEGEVRIGDIFQLGEALLQVCQPRSPCWKIDEHFGVDGIAAFIAEQGLTGWYFRVVRAGTVAPDTTLDILESDAGAPTLLSAMAVWRLHRPDPAELRQIAATPGIAAGWRRKIEARAAWLDGDGAPPLPPPPLFHVKPEER
jgi:MOSC domain-containing protein YiiM